MSAKVRVTRNFERNLSSIAEFLHEDGGEQSPAFQALLDRLFETVVPNLEEFPAIGYDLLGRKAASYEGVARAAALSRRLPAGASLREYVSGEYLVLYAWIGDVVHLLAIKHHRQLSFDLRGHWLD